MRRFEMRMLWESPDVLSAECVIYGYDALAVCLYSLEDLRRFYGDTRSSFPRCFFLEEI